MSKERIARLFLLFSVCLLIVSICFYYYSPEIITFGWHLTHSDKINWQGLNIVVPKFLIVKHKDNKLFMYKMRSPKELIIVFSKINSNYNPDNYKKLNFNIIEENKITFLGKDVMLVKAVGEENRFEYMEDMHFLSNPISITFMGNQANRNVFIEIVNNLSWGKI